MPVKAIIKHICVCVAIVYGYWTNFTLTLYFLDVFHCERYVIWMFFTANVMLFGCFFYCERYVNWMFFTVNVMLFGCLSLLTLCSLDVFHC